MPYLPARTKHIEIALRGSIHRANYATWPRARKRLTRTIDLTWILFYAACVGFDACTMASMPVAAVTLRGQPKVSFPDDYRPVR